MKQSIKFYQQEITLCLKCILNSLNLLTIADKEKTQKFKETGDSRYIYRNELDKACFQYDMTYGVFKDLGRMTASDKVLRDKAFNIAKNPKYERYQRVLASMVYKFFDKKSKGGSVKSAIKNEIKQLK